MRLASILLSITPLLLLPVSSLAMNRPPATLITTLPTHNLTLPSSPITDAAPKCVRIDDPPMAGLNPTNCDAAIPMLCRSLREPSPRDAWIWTELPGCALGVYLPDKAWKPHTRACHGDLGFIVDKCSRDSRFNAGGLNVAEMPSFGGPGRAETEGAVMYAMAPRRLTLPS